MCSVNNLQKTVIFYRLFCFDVLLMFYAKFEFFFYSGAGTIFCTGGRGETKNIHGEVYEEL